MTKYYNDKCIKCKKIKCIFSKKLCTTCWREQRSKKECKRCYRVRYIVAKGYCGSCYNNYIGNTPNWYRKVIIESDKEVKCLFCKENREVILEVHHIDGNRNNNKLNNLVWLCPNHHREVTIGFKTIL